MSDEFAGLGAKAAAGKIAAGEISAEQLVRACLDRIAAREDVIKAWVFLDPELALEQARAVAARGCTQSCVTAFDRPTGRFGGLD